MTRGRKPKSGVAFGKPIAFRLPADAELDFRSKAAAAGMTLADFLRECVLKNRTQIVVRKPVSQDHRMMLYAVNKAGNNLNQLAHAANTAKLTGKASEGTYLAILDHLQWIEQFMTSLLAHVD